MAEGAAGPRWAIATPSAPATEAGAAAFEAGGNAFDAALAAAATIAVTYPQACGVGGDLFAVVHRAQGDVLAVNASGRSPAGADPAALRARFGTTMPDRGPDPITVPGAVSGWDTLHRIGATRAWSDHLEGAIRYAHDGVPVASAVAAGLHAHRDLFAADPGMAGVFFRDGQPVHEGELLANPALGRTLEAVAAGGAEALYTGAVGAAYVEGLRAAGSPLTTDDLGTHRAAIVPPLAGRYGDVHLRVAPPNSAGYALLQILAAAERLRLDPDPTGSDAGLHARIFLASLADVQRHLADPDRMVVHVSTLLEDGHLSAFAEEVRAPIRAATRTGRPGGDTIGLVAADAAGNVVSLIQSLFEGFGSGILEPATGIVAHDRGACFTLERDHPNTFAPAALPAHTLLPAIVMSDIGPLGAVGTRGGYQQPQIDAQAILRCFVLGASPAAAVGAPRFEVDDLPGEGGPPDAVVEADVPPPARAAIEGAGLAVRTVGVHDGWMGPVQVVRVGANGLEAAADPRSDGAALAG